MLTNRWSLLAGCTALVMATTAVSTVGGTLFGLLAESSTRRSSGDGGLIPSWVERFAVAGLMAGVIVGVCVAWDHAATFAGSGEREEDERAGDWEPLSDWPGLPADASARRYAPHEVNGHTLRPRRHRWT